MLIVAVEKTDLFTVYTFAFAYSVNLWCSSISNMADLEEQRVCVKFCFKLGKTAPEIYKMLKQTFGAEAILKMAF